MDVNIALRGFSHSFPGDVDVMLQAPGGRRTIIMSDSGSTHGVAGVNLAFDDQARTFLPRSPRLVSGRYRPTNNDGDGDPFPFPGARTTNAALSIFKGINPNGYWKLFVVDDWVLDEGIMAGGWALRIRASVTV